MTRNALRLRYKVIVRRFADRPIGSQWCVIYGEAGQEAYFADPFPSEKRAQERAAELRSLHLVDLREAIARRLRVPMGAEMCQRAEADTGLWGALADVESQLLELRGARLRIAELLRPCPDCGSPMPGDMCAACALSRAEEEVASLRRQLRKRTSR